MPDPLVPARSAVWAEHALLESGWAQQVAVRIDADGRIAAIDVGQAPEGYRVGVLLPGVASLHSHGFQRAIAGLTEARGARGTDSFWTWRETLYDFLGRLEPADVQAVTAQAYLEMLRAGFTAVAEFHYLHHQVDGIAYDDRAEMGCRVMEAAHDTGIGLTLLPVLYQQGGCDGRPLGRAQRRFGCSLDEFSRLLERTRDAARFLSNDAVVGRAGHSLRAVTKDALQALVGMHSGAPMHLHVAEQQAEVDEVFAVYGARPVQWLLANHQVDADWCLVHATQTDDAELLALARTGAVAGLCPITEANLGDGIFDAARFIGADGCFGIGSDSNVRISVNEELRLLEYSQRLRDRSRSVLAGPDRSTGRLLYEQAARGGARACGRPAGTLAVGRFADMIAIDQQAVTLAGLQGDTLLDAFVFASGDGLVTDVWSAGRHVLRDRRHANQEAIEAAFRDTMRRLRTA